MWKALFTIKSYLGLMTYTSNGDNFCQFKNSLLGCGLGILLLLCIALHAHMKDRAKHHYCHRPIGTKPLRIKVLRFAYLKGTKLL